MKIGALLAGAPSDDVENLYRFGEAMGLAFQLQDDYLDVYGDPKVFGKAIGGDITSNKKTFMLINALQKADGADKEELEQWIRATDFDREEKVRAVTSLYDKLSIDQLAKDKMEIYYQKALQAIAKVNVPDDKKAPLLAYAARMMKREK